MFQPLLRKKDELIHLDAAKRKGIEVIKRFSGGGTVVVDHNTVFATLIMQAEAVPGVECYPRPVMQWSESFYKPVFSPHGPFRLQEHGEAAFTDSGAHGMLAVAVMAEDSAIVMQRSAGSAERAVCQRGELLGHMLRMQTTRTGSRNLVAMPRPSPSRGGCTTLLFCGTLMTATWRC